MNLSPATLSGGDCSGVSGSVLCSVLETLPHNKLSGVVALQDPVQVVHCLDYVSCYDVYPLLINGK
jgi:hypothetical protein